MIVLATLNAKYIHASLGLRYLMANMGALQPQATVCEFTIDQRPIDIVEAILARQPRIVGLGVYIWNVEETTRVVALLKAVAPGVRIVIGGPEVSYEVESQPIVALADHVITGWGDVTFPALCRELLAGAVPAKVIAGEQPPLDQIAMPYRLYDDEDIAHRLIYVEASRGCPYKCEFCLSALDRTAWPFDPDRFLEEMAALHARGARHFKFVDRTFNLGTKTSLRILEFFLDRLDDRLFLHFELVPDHLPEALKQCIARFPAGSLQFEIGIQSFDPDVQVRISRRQDNDRAEANLRWLREHSQAHLHADLIVGLPGEDVAGFARGFDRLVALDPHEIQVGILKRLRGTPIARHADAHAMRYNPHPPYNVLQTGCIDFATMQRLSRFARYWDMFGNSGRFARTRARLLGDSPFVRFMAFSDWLHARTARTHRIALDRQFDLLAEYLEAGRAGDAAAALADLAEDYRASGLRGSPPYLAHGPDRVARTPSRRQVSNAARQQRHRDRLLQ